MSRTRARRSVKRLAGGGEWVISRAVVPGPRGIGLSPFGQRASLCQRARRMACWKVARARLDWSLCRAMVSRNRRFGLVLRIGEIRFPRHKNGRHNNSFERTALSGRRSTQTLGPMSFQFQMCISGSAISSESQHQSASSTSSSGAAFGAGAQSSLRSFFPRLLHSVRGRGAVPRMGPGVRFGVWSTDLAVE
jgi:hypothetical protein